MTGTNLEIGGDFDWSGAPAGPYIPWPTESIWFGRGRDAVTAIFQSHRARLGENARLLVPDYFCQDVADFWQRAGIAVAYYRDDPSLPHPDWSSVDRHGAGLLLAVNFFGVRDMSIWRDRYGSDDAYILVEDQTHDPFCPGAAAGVADYAFASVRKIFPVSDGAILWSPSRAGLPSVNLQESRAGSSLKLAAMVLKMNYLSQLPRVKSLKEKFRWLQIQGEKDLESFPEILSLTPWSHSVLEAGYPVAWRDRRDANVRFIVEALRDSKRADSLIQDWLPGQCPFNAILCFSSQTERDMARAQLIDAGVYAPVHWEISASISKEAHELSCRVLTLPVDHRYDEEDLVKILKIIG